MLHMLEKILINFYLAIIYFHQQFSNQWLTSKNGKKNWCDPLRDISLGAIWNKMIDFASYILEIFLLFHLNHPHVTLKFSLSIKPKVKFILFVIILFFSTRKNKFSLRACYKGFIFSCIPKYIVIITVISNTCRLLNWKFWNITMFVLTNKFHILYIFLVHFMNLEINNSLYACTYRTALTI